MNVRLDHLPEGKQRELDLVVEIIREGFAFAVARRTMPRLCDAKLLKIILFGSYARGDWVEDPVGRYFSDYDLLVVVNSNELTDVAEFWAKTEEWLLEELSAGTKLRTPVSIIYHSLDDVNEKLGSAVTSSQTLSAMESCFLRSRETRSSSRGYCQQERR